MRLRCGHLPIRRGSLRFDLNLISRSRASAHGSRSRSDSPSFASLGVKWVSNRQIKCSTVDADSRSVGCLFDVGRTGLAILPFSDWSVIGSFGATLAAWR